jgi:glycosyltransferase involved in cell wall biosynthesis
MKVLLVNKFYYNRGGDCTAVLGTEQLLKKKGHEVAVFSSAHPLNLPTPWSKYFPKEVNFSSSGFSGKTSSVIRIFHSSETAHKFKRLLDDFRPDVVHAHNIHSYISPLVVEIAHKKGIRVVWTLHDYKLICPTYTCLRNGKICEACFRDKSNVFKYKCMKNSRLAGLLAWMEAGYWNREKLSAVTDLFISPSLFLKSKMSEAGYPDKQIEVLPNFMPRQAAVSAKKENYYCYLGRLSGEKGVEYLLEAAKDLPYPLKIIGGGPLQDAYKKKYAGYPVEFLGQMQPEAFYPIVQKARFLVIPSIWYENNPFSVIESLCMGTPVLGSRIGGIPELIGENENGVLFTPGDSHALSDKIKHCFEYFTDDYDFKEIADKAQNKFGPETFYNKLMKVYSHK